MILETVNAHPLPVLNLGNRDVLIENLLFLYGAMVASESLLIEALKQPMPEELRQYYASHLEEEHDHAAWLLDDLQSAGVTPPRVHWGAARIAGAQYYLIRHVSPVALLGYIAALESRPMPMETVEALEALHGKDLLRTCRYHAEHDPGHGAAVLQLIEGLSDDDFELVRANAAETSAAVHAQLKPLQGEFVQ